MTKNNAKSNVFLSADPSNAQRNRPIAQRDRSIGGSRRSGRSVDSA